MADDIGMQLVEEFLAEEKLISNFLGAEKSYEELCKQVDKHFMDLVRELIEEFQTNPSTTKAEYLRLCEGLSNRCPWHVTKCFIQDAIRQAFKGGVIVSIGGLTSLTDLVRYNYGKSTNSKHRRSEHQTVSNQQL